MKKISSDRIFDVVNTCAMVILLFVFAWPLWFVIIASFSDPQRVIMGEVLLIPKGISMDGYNAILEYKELWTGFANSIFITLVGTIINMFFTVCVAYPLSDKKFRARHILTVFYMITMYFGGGLIPHYLLYRQMGILNTRWALIFPAMVSVYNCLIVRSYFQNSIPEALHEAATIDGATHFQRLFMIVLPLSKPSFAVVGLYYVVGHWNDFSRALYYVYDESKYPVQSILRKLLLTGKMLSDSYMSGVVDAEQMVRLMNRANMMQYGIIIVAAVPVLLIYPFVQKFFVKGVMIGSVKG